MSDDAPLPVTVAVTTAPLPEGFSIPGVVALARDLAIGMYDEPVLLKKHGISTEQYATLKTVPYFITVVQQMSKAWNEPASAQQRLALQTAVGLEEVLPDVIARAKIKNEPLQGVAQLVKVLADIAGAIGNTRQTTAPGEKFKITINLGSDTEVYNKTKPAFILEAVPAESDVVQIQPQPSGFGALLSIQTEPEKT